MKTIVERSILLIIVVIVAIPIGAYRATSALPPLATPNTWQTRACARTPCRPRRRWR